MALLASSVDHHPRYNGTMSETNDKPSRVSPKIKRLVAGFALGACAGYLPLAIIAIVTLSQPPQQESWGAIFPALLLYPVGPVVGFITGIVGAIIGYRRRRD